MRKSGIIAQTLAGLGIFALMGVMFAAVAAPQEQNMNSNSNMNSNMKSGKGGMMMSLNSTDKKFMMMAAQGGMAEVKMAEAALQHSSSDSVKTYAQKMIDDHTAANTELMQIASSKGVTLPTAPDAKMQAMMTKMMTLNGADFDREYIKNAGVKDHEKMEKLFMEEGSKGGDADTKAFATKTLPTVQMHLSMAREMMSSMMGMKGKMGMGSGSNMNSNMGSNMNSNMSGMNSNMGGNMNSNMSNMNSNMNMNKSKNKNSNMNMNSNMNSNMNKNSNLNR